MHGDASFKIYPINRNYKKKVWKMKQFYEWTQTQAVQFGQKNLDNFSFCSIYSSIYGKIVTCAIIMYVKFEIFTF